MEERLLKDTECSKIVGVCRATWWNGVRDGFFPEPVRLTPRTTRWRQSDVYALFEKKGG